MSGGLNTFGDATSPEISIDELSKSCHSSDEETVTTDPNHQTPSTKPHRENATTRTTASLRTRTFGYTETWPSQVEGASLLRK